MRYTCAGHCISNGARHVLQHCNATANATGRKREHGGLAYNVRVPAEAVPGAQMSGTVPSTLGFRHRCTQSTHLEFVAAMQAAVKKLQYVTRLCEVLTQFGSRISTGKVSQTYTLYIGES